MLSYISQVILDLVNLIANTEVPFVTGGFMVRAVTV